MYFVVCYISFPLVTCARARSRRRLPLLRYVYSFALEHGEQCLRRLKNLAVSGLRLLNRPVVLVSRGDLSGQLLVQMGEPPRQDGEVVLNFRLLLLVAR